MIDSDSTSNEDINTVLHIHCYHTRNFYSKFSYRDGKYKNRQPLPNSNKINEYIFNIAKQAELL